MDISVSFCLFPQNLKGTLIGNIDNESPMDLVVYFLKPLIDI